jgi:transcriptional regulator with XRE-family HTH domain
MPPRSNLDRPTRERIRAWLNYKMKSMSLTIAATADIMGVSAAAVSRVADGSRTPGLDFVLAMYRKLQIPLELLVERRPEQVYETKVSRGSNSGLRGQKMGQ